MANSQSITIFACFFLLCHTFCVNAEGADTDSTYQVRPQIDTTLEGMQLKQQPAPSRPLRNDQAVCEASSNDSNAPKLIQRAATGPVKKTSTKAVDTGKQSASGKPQIGSVSDSTVGCRPLNTATSTHPVAKDEQPFSSNLPELQKEGSSDRTLSGCHPVSTENPNRPVVKNSEPTSAVPPVPLVEELQRVALNQYDPNLIDQVSFSGFQRDRRDLVEFDIQQTPFFGSPLETTSSQHPMSGLKYLPTPQVSNDPKGNTVLIIPSDSEDYAEGNFVDDLQGLIDQQPSDSGSYLTELNQLLGDQPAWILTHGQLIDLGTDESKQSASEVTYLHELESLIGDHHVLAECRRVGNNSELMQCATTASLHPAPANSQTDQDRYYEIPREEACNQTGGDSVTGLFKPMSEIQITGVSSAPPQPSKNAKVSSLTLVRPPNEACSYLQLDIPMHYLTSGYGVRRAPRNTHRFCHNPLYFEDPNLERCGQSKGCLTTACSMVHFTAMTSILPYLTTADPPRSCVAALPDCPTCHSYASDAYFPEWSWKAATVQAAAVTGLVFVIP